MRANLLETLFRKLNGNVVSITGSGGKTSLMIAMARHARAIGQSVLITTTTKLGSPMLIDYGADFIFMEGMGETGSNITAGQTDASKQGSVSSLSTPDISQHMQTNASKPHIASTPHIDSKPPIASTPSPASISTFAPGQTSVTFLASRYSEEKASAPNLELLRSWIPGFDLVLIEADGARHRNLKFHQACDPVVIPQTTTTIALAGLGSWSQTACEDNFFNVPDEL
ncbi:MAG: hypothetical protein ACTTJZ_04485, partial [Sphaerochaetaceae bacterium]